MVSEPEIRSSESWNSGDALKNTSVTTLSFVSPLFPLSESRQGFNLAVGLGSGDSQQWEEHSHGVATTGTSEQVAGSQQQVECMQDALACDNNEQASARQVTEEFEAPTFVERHGASTSTAREVSGSGFDVIGNEVERSANDFSDADRSSFDTSARNCAVQACWPNGSQSLMVGPPVDSLVAFKAPSANVLIKQDVSITPILGDELVFGCEFANKKGVNLRDQDTLEM
ncbi:hypothetical protein V6N12_054017 [Hibiscus sabdariffa]|uniref:Uncharacterized protein n=1 Tax=Hibiscus sabdariffa TaxID=183260 RepID=A0ABR2D9B2_9ROSI